jgi:hypothetical protein
VDEVLAAGTRLVFGTLALLEANADVICPHLASHLPEVLTSGLLRRYLEQGNVAPLGNGGQS